MLGTGRSEEDGDPVEDQIEQLYFWIENPNSQL